MSSWRTSPGTQVKLDTATGDRIEDIAQLDLRSVDGTQVLMSGTVSGPH